MSIFKYLTNLSIFYLFIYLLYFTYLFFSLDFPKSNCGEKCNPINKKVDPQVTCCHQVSAAVILSCI